MLTDKKLSHKLGSNLHKQAIPNAAKQLAKIILKPPVESRGGHGCGFQAQEAKTSRGGVSKLRGEFTYAESP